MLRFCDREIYYITERELEKRWVLKYFVDQNRTEPIYILDEEGKYVGCLNPSGLCDKDYQKMICRDYILFDENIWKNGRAYFARDQVERKDIQQVLLPVLDCEYHLVCFAWQDDEANRELRMLDELSMCRTALDFRDVYPQYDSVTIHGCNELSYYFAQYLNELGISVNVTGILWEQFEEWKSKKDIKNGMLDYRHLDIFGESVESGQVHVEERRSVSAEFECIDSIYEENLRQGIIRDTNVNCVDLLKLLSGKSIGILGTDDHSLYAYNLLLEYGIDICCFICDSNDQHDTELAGKKILSSESAVRQWENLIFIRTDAKHSAWGLGGTDRYHYMGYQRNIRYFLLEDYIQSPSGSLKNILRHLILQSEKRLVLTGDKRLCFRLIRMLESYGKISQEHVVYCDFLEGHREHVQKVCGGGQTEYLSVIDSELLSLFSGCSAREVV